MTIGNATPFLVKCQPVPELVAGEVLDELLEAKRHYDYVSQTNPYSLQAGTTQTFRTTRSGGPILFSDDDSKPSDG